MPLADTSMRGAALNRRLGVNGIQKASRLAALDVEEEFVITKSIPALAHDQVVLSGNCLLRDLRTNLHAKCKSRANAGD